MDDTPMTILEGFLIPGAPPDKDAADGRPQPRRIPQPFQSEPPRLSERRSPHRPRPPAKPPSNRDKFALD